MIRIAVSGIPRGYQFPQPDGNWLHDKHKAQILAVSPRIELVEIPAHRVQDVGGIEVLLAEGGNRTHYPGELDRADYLKFFTPGLRWVQLCSTGFSDNITPEVLDGRVMLTNAPGLHTVPIAESVIAAMLDHAKRLKKRRVHQGDHRWQALNADELWGKTALIIGLGRIGRRTAQLCKAFGMRVIGTKRIIAPVPHVDTVFPADELAMYLPDADYIVLAAPHTAETANMLGETAFRAMSRTAYLINIGRGELVEEPVLIKALQEGWTAGAYLDTFVREPLPEDHALWDMENVLIVPHDSHSSPYIGDRVVGIFCANLERYVAGEPPEHICDPAKGY